MPSQIATAPNFRLYRTVEDAADSGPYTSKAQGINAQGKEWLHVQVVPSAAANPAVAVRTWSQAAGQFIAQNAAVTKAGAGAGVAYEFSFQVNGRLAFIEVTGGVAGSDTVEIHVSTYGQDLIG